MSDAIVGGVVTGMFALLVLIVTLRHNTAQAERAEAERARVRRADRLRDSYRDYVLAAYALQGRASLLPIALIESERGRPSYFNELIDKRQADVSRQNASLMLEEDIDQAILREFRELSSDDMAFLAAINLYLKKNEHMPNDEYLERIRSMRARADMIAELARERLAELEKPPRPKTHQWKWPWSTTSN